MPVDSTLLLEFLKVFARFEYALKRSGYCEARNDVAQAHWDRFENELANVDQDLLQPVIDNGNYLLSNPPRKQTWKNGKLGWDSSVPTASDIKKLLIFVRRVRNNLFHGGKFPDGPVHGTERDSELIRVSLTVLRTVLKVPIAVKVKNEFDQN